MTVIGCATVVAVVELGAVGAGARRRSGPRWCRRPWRLAGAFGERGDLQLGHRLLGRNGHFGLRRRVVVGAFGSTVVVASAMVLVVVAMRRRRRRRSMAMPPTSSTTPPTSSAMRRPSASTSLCALAWRAPPAGTGGWPSVVHAWRYPRGVEATGARPDLPRQPFRKDCSTLSPAVPMSLHVGGDERVATHEAEGALGARALAAVGLVATLVLPGLARRLLAARHRAVAVAAHPGRRGRRVPRRSCAGLGVVAVRPLTTSSGDTATAHSLPPQSMRWCVLASSRCTRCAPRCWPCARCSTWTAWSWSTSLRGRRWPRWPPSSRPCTPPPTPTTTTACG